MIVPYGSWLIRIGGNLTYVYMLQGEFGGGAIALAAVVALAISLLASAGRGLMRGKGNQPILASGALAACTALLVVACLAECLKHPGIAYCAALFAAVAAVGGDFEEEMFEE